MTIPTVAQVESGAAPVYVDVNNVAEWFINDKELQIKDMKDLAPIGMPPFPHMYMFFRLLGHPLVAECVNEEVHVDFVANGVNIVGDMMLSVGISSIVNPHKGAAVRHFVVHHPLDGNGHTISGKVLLTTQDENNNFSGWAEEFIEKFGVNNFGNYAATCSSIVLFAISLMHCKNIDLVEKQNPTTRQYRRMMKRKKQPIIQYKTLNIDAFKKQVRYESKQSGENEIKRALHICRGHFATYTEDSPLFGKYVGTYWKPMHARGSSALGEVRKNYSIDID